MKFFENTCTFDYPWTEVSIANWRKYCAWNQHCKHVIAVDTLSRTVTPSGKLQTERLITTSQTPPPLLAPLFKSLNLPTTSHVYELSLVTPPSSSSSHPPEVSMHSTNLTLTQLMRVSESVSYTPDPHSAGKTRFTQHAEIEATLSGWEVLKRKVESWGVEAFGGNAEKGREGFRSVLEMGRRGLREWEVGGGLEDGEVARRI